LKWTVNKLDGEARTGLIWRAGFLEWGYETSGFIKRWEFLDWMRIGRFLSQNLCMEFSLDWLQHWSKTLAAMYVMAVGNLKQLRGTMAGLGLIQAGVMTVPPSINLWGGGRRKQDSEKVVQLNVKCYYCSSKLTMYIVNVFYDQQMCKCGDEVRIECPKK
jgi:hypothetical protein